MLFSGENCFMIPFPEEHIQILTKNEKKALSF